MPVFVARRDDNTFVPIKHVSSEFDTSEHLKGIEHQAFELSEVRRRVGYDSDPDRDWCEAENLVAIQKYLNGAK